MPCGFSGKAPIDTASQNGKEATPTKETNTTVAMHIHIPIRMTFKASFKALLKPPVY
jgi:hypothetical protein